MKRIDTYISTIERISSIDNYISTFKRISSIDDYIIEKLHINKDVKVLNIPLYFILTNESTKFPLELNTPINFEIIDYYNKSKKCTATHCNRLGQTDYTYVFYNENGPLFLLTLRRLTKLFKDKSVDNVYMSNIGRVTVKLLEE